MKVGHIRCLQTEDLCPATTCFQVMREKKLAFKGIKEEIEVVGVNTCGGCSGKKAVTRAAEMVKRGADTIVLASCIFKGLPLGFPCPYAQQIKDAIGRYAKPARVIDYTH